MYWSTHLDIWITLKIELTKLDKSHSLDKDFYSKRALLLFQLKNYDAALIDIEKYFQEGLNTTSDIYLKAWILEIKGEYDESIKLYNKVAELSNMNSFYIFSEVAKRKKLGL